MLNKVEIAQRNALLKRLPEVTRPGRLQDWNERIGDIVALAGLGHDEINWSQAPAYVALDVVRLAERKFSSTKGFAVLNEAIEKYEAST